MATDPQTLLDEGKCFSCQGVSEAEAIELALLARWASGSPEPPPFSPQAPTVTSLNEDVFAENPNCPDHVVNPPGDWEGYVGLNGIGNPTTDPGQWTFIDILFGDPCNAEWDNQVPVGQYFAVRLKTDGLWSPWTIFHNV